MSRITPPTGKTWNQYIEEQANAGSDQTLAGRRLTKRNIKLNQIAKVERQQASPSPSNRPYNKYTTPGTVSPATGRPWTT